MRHDHIDSSALVMPWPLSALLLLAAPGLCIGAGNQTVAKLPHLADGEVKVVRMQLLGNRTVPAH